MSLKKLEALFAKNSTTTDNQVSVSSDFYYGTLPKGVTKKQADQVNQHNHQFAATSLGVAKDTLVGLVDNDNGFDGGTVSFDLGTAGVSISHTINKDENADNGIDIFTEFEQVHEAGSDLGNIYQDIQGYFADGGSVDGDE